MAPVASSMEAERVAPAGWCLRLTFRLDLSHKHRRFTEQDIAQLNPRDFWRVAGKYDFLKIERPPSLEDVGELVSPPPWADHRHLVIFPFAGFEPAPEILEVLQRPDDAKFADVSKYPLLALIRVTLLSAAFQADTEGGKERPQFGVGAGVCLKVIRNLASLLHRDPKRKSPLPKFTGYFGSLGSPDLVVLALPETPQELLGVHALANAARDLRLTELDQGKFQVEDDYDEATAERPGHACVVVHPLLGFRAAARKRFDNPEFQAEEDQAGIRIRCRLRPACGHESQVVEDMVKLCGNEVSFDQVKGQDQHGPTTAWDTYTLHATLAHLSIFARAWDELWFDPEWKWRRINLIDSYTTVSFQDEDVGWGHPTTNWVLTKSLSSTLDDVETSADQFADNFLNATQAFELKNMVSSFRSCFSRQDLLGTAQDLLPFFKNLGGILSAKDAWTEYFSEETAGAQGFQAPTRLDRLREFRDSFTALIGDVGRAVRNRIEHRSVVGDPPFPQTLPDGCCKLLSAYTSLAYLCWEMFLGGSQPFASTDHFAACVRAGVSGRVESRELFQGFRRFLERRDERAAAAAFKPEMPVVAGGQRGRKRLLVFDLSGKSLFRPELLVAHGLHEAAEQSPWIEFEETSKLRKVLNTWVIHEATACLEQATTEIAPTARAQTDEQEWTQFFSSFGPYCLTRQDLELDRSYSDQAAPWKDRCRSHLAVAIPRYHPVRLSNYLYDSFLNVGTRQGIIAQFAEDMWGGAPNDYKEPPFHAQQCVRAAGSKQLGTHFRSFGAIVTEVVADIGAWAALSRLVCPSGPMPPGERLANLNKVFLSIFAIAREATGNGAVSPSLRKFLALRWAIQIAAALPAGEWLGRLMACVDEHSAEVGEDAIEFLKTAVRHKTRFGDEKGLVAMLRWFVPYGGEIPVHTADPGQPGDGNHVLEVLGTCWKGSGRTLEAARLEYLTTLWAMSMRAVFPRVLDPLDMNG